MSWMDSWQNWVGLGIYVLALTGAIYLIGHAVFLFQERARRQRRRRQSEAVSHRMRNQEERYRTFMDDKEVGK